MSLLTYIKISISRPIPYICSATQTLISIYLSRVCFNLYREMEKRPKNNHQTQSKMVISIIRFFHYFSVIHGQNVAVTTYKYTKTQIDFVHFSVGCYLDKWIFDRIFTPHLTPIRKSIFIHCTTNGIMTMENNFSYTFSYQRMPWHLKMLANPFVAGPRWGWPSSVQKIDMSHIAETIISVCGFDDASF